jgi:hypothetical protein
MASAAGVSASRTSVFHAEVKAGGVLVGEAVHLFNSPMNIGLSRFETGDARTTVVPLSYASDIYAIWRSRRDTESPVTYSPSRVNHICDCGIVVKSPK